MSDYHPFPRALDHQLRTLATLFGKNDGDQNEAVYLIRKALAEAYSVGHQDGFMVGMENAYIVDSTKALHRKISEE
jgi:hypothetical protein